MCNISAATIKLSIAAIGFQCKMYNVEDITQCFLIKKMMIGIYKTTKHVDNRLPITLEILNKILVRVDHVCTSLYETNLFAAMFT